MRHRSHIAFILLAAALFAAPQMAQDLSTLKGALAARIRGEILQAFLGLHANETAAAVKQQAPRVETPLLACDAGKSEAQPAQVARKKGAERAIQSQRTETRTQTAMLTDPVDKTNAGLPPSAIAAELASLPRQVLTETRLAMLTQPGNGVEPPPALAFRQEGGDARTKATPAARDKFAELERHAVFFQARFERGAEGVWLRRAAEDAARAVEGSKTKVRVQKVRRPAKACGGDNMPCAFAPIASLAKPDAAIMISDGE
jgi:hypothetical protein